MANKENTTLSGFPLHNIKRVTAVGDYDWLSSAEKRVNQLLSKGWVLLALHTKEMSPKNQALVYTLGHTDPSADDGVAESEDTSAGMKVEE